APGLGAIGGHVLAPGRERRRRLKEARLVLARLREERHRRPHRRIGKQAFAVIGVPVVSRKRACVLLTLSLLMRQRRVVWRLRETPTAALNGRRKATGCRSRYLPHPSPLSMSRIVARSGRYSTMLRVPSPRPRDPPSRKRTPLMPSSASAFISLSARPWSMLPPHSAVPTPHRVSISRIALSPLRSRSTPAPDRYSTNSSNSPLCSRPSISSSFVQGRPTSLIAKSSA